MYRNFVICMMLALAACGDAVDTVDERLRPVRFMTISDVDVDRDRSFSGTSKSSRESRLSFKVSGTIVELPVQIGQRLNAGDLIAALESNLTAGRVDAVVHAMAVLDYAPAEPAAEKVRSGRAEWTIRLVPTPYSEICSKR